MKAFSIVLVIWLLAIPVMAHDPTDDPKREPLPVGDGQYSDQGPMQNGIFLCNLNFNPRAGGAQAQGAWFNEDGTWNRWEKINVQGEVAWPDAYVSITLEGDTRRVVMSNNLPDHTTGLFPVAQDDPAYQLDRNPNSIQPQAIQFDLPATPQLAAQPNCMGGLVGIMTNGVLLFNALDELGRDAVAWEVQDACNGHPQISGAYHYHGHIDCMEDVEAGTGHSMLLGYALDGFGLYGKYGDDGHEMTNDDLDACHGHSGVVEWNGELVEMYHYHLTDEYPYSVGCFSGTPSESQPVEEIMAGTQRQSPHGQGQGNPPPPQPNNGR